METDRLSIDEEVLNLPSPYHDLTPSTPDLIMPRSTPWFQRLSFIPLSNDENKVTTEETYSYTRPLLAHGYLLWCILALLVLSSLLQLTLLFRDTHAPYSPGHFLDPHPFAALERHELVNNYSYQDIWHDHDAVWEQLQRPNGVQGGEIKFAGMERTVGISMFHQLHCISGFRAAMQLLQEGKDIGHDAFTDHA
jgi:hypothetical protein